MSEKEILTQLVKESNSITDILRKLSKSVSGDSIKLLKEKLDLYGILYQFIPIKSGPKKLELKEILKENVSYKSDSLKKRLIESGLKKNCCECCGQNSNWNNKPLTLLLHHINENHLDNRLENLLILCPNCHSLMHSIKPTKPKNYCCDCGVEITKKSKRCRSCSILYNKNNNSSKVKPSEEEFINLLKIKNFTDIGKLFGVTESAVRKWCKSYNLPNKKSDLKLYFDNLN